jgi:uncharacterized membrane protein YbaN (DUF454 family)
MFRKQHTNKLKVSQNPVVKLIFMIAGFVFVAIGIAGMFLPLLPTTVFLLLAAACFARSSEKFYNWLHTNKYFGRYLSTYRSSGGMSKASKVNAIIVLWLTILASAYFSLDKIYIVILLFIIAIGVTIHLIRIPTIKEHAQE